MKQHVVGRAVRGMTLYNRKILSFLRANTFLVSQLLCVGSSIAAPRRVLKYTQRSQLTPSRLIYRPERTRSLWRRAKIVQGLGTSTRSNLEREEESPAVGPLTITAP
jgi:hypothetical protein